ncbi:hypothetical protein [Vibrio sp. MA40-2]|uniref:hypothetical protein n=1 Tax=Vibrio sp. MA40-2 TaxID=3391828 RepID=UPI0039A654A1
MDIDMLNSNHSICKRLVSLTPWESVQSRLLKPFSKHLCNNRFYISYDYTPDVSINDGTYFLANKNSSRLSGNMTEKELYNELRACGLREKKALRLMGILKQSSFSIHFGSLTEEDLLIFYKGDGCVIPEENTDKILFPLLFSFSEWTDITREENAGFDKFPLSKRHRLIFNTIRHNITIYDPLVNLTDYASLSRQIGEAVINKYPALRNEVLSYWDRKEKQGKNITSNYRNLSIPNNVLCGMHKFRKDVGDERFVQSGLAARFK